MANVLPSCHPCLVLGITMQRIGDDIRQTHSAFCCALETALPLIRILLQPLVQFGVACDYALGSSVNFSAEVCVEISRRWRRARGDDVEYI